jgi:hypothetical protein
VSAINKQNAIFIEEVRDPTDCIGSRNIASEGLTDLEFNDAQKK